jgi:SAM-dependent methyltransferase
LIAKRKVYIPQPEARIALRSEINIWDNLYLAPLAPPVVMGSEEWSVLDGFGLLKPGKRVLEAGCGDGPWAGVLQAKGMDVCGIDFSFQGLRRMKTNFPDVRGVMGDIKYLPFAGGFFDLVLSWGVLEHFEDLDDIDIALRETKRCLKDDGYLVVSVPYLSYNRLCNLQVVSRRLASRVNWLRKMFGKGKKIFFQWEYKAGYFEYILNRGGWTVKHRQYFWLELGLHDDFRGLYRLVKRPIYFLNRSRSGKVLIQDLFAAFMLFVCVKDPRFIPPESR